MGKLGGRELNYASDIDLLFVHDGDGTTAEHTARRLLRLLSLPGELGIVFRTDVDLRPEGAAGPLIAHARQLPGLVRDTTRARGSSRPCSRRGRWPATPHSARRSSG